MATAHGYMDGSYDYRHMYDIKDKQGKYPQMVIHKDTLLEALAKEPRCSQFFSIVCKTKLVGILNNNLQASFTLFVPLDGGIPVEYENTDAYTYRKFVLQHMMDYPLAEAYIKGTRGAYLKTRNDSSIYLKNLDGQPTLNGSSNIVESIRIGTGIIYFIDRSLDSITSFI